MSRGGGWRLGKREESSLVLWLPCMRPWEGGGERREEEGG